MPSPDFVILGQGLAGTALAWQLLRRRRSVLVIDAERADSASRLAAGLVTPVTGKRLAKSWRWDELYPAAVAFYRAREADTGADFFHQRPALRVFASEGERDEYHRRADMLHGLVRPADVPACFDAPFGGFEMPDAARLDVPRYLDASREYFRARGAYLKAEVDPRQPFDAATVIDCRGFAPDTGLRFNAAKGEVLTVRVPGLSEPRVVHRGIWLSPVGHELYRVGATYTHDPLDASPTPEGRAEIEAKLRALLKLSFEVIEHRAAVRPVVDAGYPVFGRDPAHPRRAHLNGLGSKGSLLAPFFAEQLVALL